MTKTYYKALPNGYTLTDTENIKLYIPDIANDTDRTIATEDAIDALLASRVVGDIPQEETTKRSNIFRFSFTLFGLTNGISVDTIMNNQKAANKLEDIFVLRGKDLAKKAVALDTYAYMKDMTLTEEEFLDLVPPMIRMAAHNDIKVLEDSDDLDGLINGAMREKVRTHIFNTSEIIYTHNFLATQRTRQENLNRLKNDPVDYLLNCTVDEFGDCGIDWM